MSSADLPVVAGGARLRPRRGALGRQLRSELRLIFTRRRNIALLVLLGLVPLIVGIAVDVAAPRPGEGPPFISQVSGNGLFLTFTALSVALPVFLPLAVAVVSGDAVAGEANTGTLRYLLTVPVSRTRLLAVKSAGLVAYVAAAVLVVAVVGGVVGGSLFGLHQVTLLSGDTVSLANGLLRALGVAAYVVIALLGLAAVGMFFSTLTEVPVGAMAATVIFVIACAILDSIPQLGSLRGALLTHHWLDFGELLRRSPDLGQLVRWSLLPLAYVAIFGSLAWARLTSADVTS